MWALNWASEAPRTKPDAPGREVRAERSEKKNPAPFSYETGLPGLERLEI